MASMNLRLNEDASQSLEFHVSPSSPQGVVVDKFAAYIR
jgi:hypothetical protein